VWADKFVGLKFKLGGRDWPEFDCYGLVRWVLFEQSGLVLPRYDGDDKREIAHHAMAMKQVSVDAASPLDVAVLLTDIRVGLTWKSAPVHIGVFVSEKAILHVEEGFCSRVQPAADLRIHSIVRVTG
jgi:cell wall-associated NlpC family hydrolase